MRKIGIFGGTFDPVHLGHLRPALEIRDALSLDEVRFIPAGCPPHRHAPVAPARLRLALLEAALAGVDGFRLDEREIGKTTPCYTVDTLAELRREFPRDALYLMVGMDAFLGFPGWHDWQRVFELAHVVVAHRPGWVMQVRGALHEALAARRAEAPESLAGTQDGRILLQPVTQLEISASRVRACLAGGGDPRYLVPEPVRELLLESNAYANCKETG
ncbi:MAG TPA: nicotinate-nucleotide adenylyltransferase [Gammaproteobacteria bacterium]|nr:nicotinate-nucleotide adenylyltransferase [Gammaproteobacteria bacterium]